MKRLALAVAVVSFWLSGCALLRSLFESAFKRPTLTFRDVTFADAALSGITVNTHWTLENPNPVGISLAEVAYLFSVEGKQVVAGSPPNGLQIPARGHTELVFPANVKFADIVPAVQVFLNQDQARFRAEGHIGVQTPLGVLLFPIAQEGTFEVPKVPSVQLSAPRISRIDFQQATVEFPFTFTNRNSYDLPIQGVAGALSIGGANVGTLSTGDLGVLPARGQKQVTIPLTINLRAAPQAAAALLQGQGSVGFSAQVTSGGASVPLNLSQFVSFTR